MTTATIPSAADAEAFLSTITAPLCTVYLPGQGWGKDWSVNCYWPNGDILRDTRCDGKGDTLEAAVADMWAAVEKAKNARPVLKTAAECKEAVLDLIREHDAAPASFRDAVDALPVKL